GDEGQDPRADAPDRGTGAGAPADGRQRGVLRRHPDAGRRSARGPRAGREAPARAPHRVVRGRRDALGLERRAAAEDRRAARRLRPLQREVMERMTAPVRGMHCAACVGKVERALTAVLSAPVLLGGMSHVLPWVPGVLQNPWVQLVLATPVQVWVGWQFHRGFVHDLRYRAASMSTLVSIGTSAAYLWSVAVTVWPHAFMRHGA